MKTSNRAVRPGHDEIVKMLCDPVSYPERPCRVNVVETHISYVFLTDRYAYKLKKPVRFEFLDFRAPESRRRACEEEVRANRRLAADVYLGVVPITAQPGHSPELGGRGQAIDWLVKMRRLPADAMLDQRIESGRVRQTDIDRFAAVLVDFFRTAPPLTLAPDRYRAETEQHVRANRAELLRGEHGLPAGLVKQVHTAQLYFLHTHADILAARVCDGRIVDGHGDLRPEHVCLLSNPIVFDCLEFSPELRRVDVLDELCFFAMECEFLGDDWIGPRVIEAYQKDSSDRPDERLLWFYTSYRACVRAKVCALASGTLHDAEKRRDAIANALRYIELAGAYAGRITPPLLLVVRGAMGTGKTTLAKALQDLLGIDRLGTDAIRRELFGPSPTPAEYQQGNYTAEKRQRVYDELLRRSGNLLAAGQSVILDGTFLWENTMAHAQRMAHRHGAAMVVVTCGCPLDVAEARIKARIVEGGSDSEAGPDLAPWQQRERAYLPSDAPHLEVDTTESAPCQVSRVLNSLRKQLEERVPAPL